MTKAGQTALKNIDEYQEVEFIEFVFLIEKMLSHI